MSNENNGSKISRRSFFKNSVTVLAGLTVLPGADVYGLGGKVSSDELNIAYNGSDGANWTPVAPVDFSKISPDDIDDYVIDIPSGFGASHSIDFYLGHIHRLANAVRPSPPSMGFIDIPVWRPIRYNRPYNARIMENITSLAWFYTQHQSWNPYFGNPELRKRLETALEFWVSIQNEDGRFSEYGYQQWNLAATAFATKFMGQTLELLEQGPLINRDLHERVRQSNRKAIMVTFKNEELYKHGMSFTNQYGNAFTGALAHLNLNPGDTELRSHFERRLNMSLDDFQSPAGYFYEANGPDWSYAFGTHHSNILMAWHYARHDEEVADHYATEHRRFIDWLSYNAVKQPDDEFFVLNRAIESRTDRAVLIRLESPLSEKVQLARAFNVTQEEADERLKTERQRLKDNWGIIPDLRGYSTPDQQDFRAYAFLHRDHYDWWPTETQRREAVRQLPYLASDRFNHQRNDDRFHFETTFIRRPLYYAAFNAGDLNRDSHRFGLGLLWNEQNGVLLQSQSRSGEAAWGTTTDCRDYPYESLRLKVDYAIDNTIFEPVAGAGNLADGVMEINYPLGSNIGEFGNMGRKKIRFLESSIAVEVEHFGSFTEILPLIRKQGDELITNSNRVQLKRNGNEILRIDIGKKSSVTGVSCIEYGTLHDNLNIWPLHIKAEDRLVYTLIVSP